jgi:FtsP/CotA-like multicopper oxidase with cupredoxin domain
MRTGLPMDKIQGAASRARTTLLPTSWTGTTRRHMRTDMIMLNPMMTVVADMVPDNVGIWLFHCHMPGHFTAGMRTRFHVLPR